MKVWESKASEGFADKKTEDWIEGLEDALILNEKELTRLGVDLTEDED